MEMVSVAKMRRTTARALASQPYAKHALELLQSLKKEQSLRHPFFENPSSQKTLVVIIGSNKGLCGGFNVNIGKRVRDYVAFEAQRDRSVAAVTVGKQADRLARQNNLEVIASFTDFGDLVTAEEAQSLGKVIVDEFLGGTYYSIAVAFTNYVKMMDYAPTVRPLLPVSAYSLERAFDMTADNSRDSEGETLTTSADSYIIEPSREAVINEIVPILMGSILYQALLESAAAEHSARMVAMKGATDNASNLMEELRLSYNKARQEAITREISEIAAGGAATGS